MEAKRELTTELFSPAPVHRSHPFALIIKPEPATVILRPVVLALPTGRADGRIYHFTKPLELQNFPWARRNAHVVAIECSAAHDRRNDTVHSYLSSLLLVKFLCATLYRMDQHTRLELALSVWKTDVLPLHQCWVLHPVLHGFGCALDRNPQLIFSNQSTGISEMFRRAPALTWVTLFFIRKEAICRAAGKQMKKTAAGGGNRI